MGPLNTCVHVSYDANMTPLSLTDALVCRQLDEVMDGTWKGIFNGEYISWLSCGLKTEKRNSLSVTM